MFLRRLRGFREWAKHGRWWRKTTTGKRHYAQYARDVAHERKQRDGGERVCAGCGKTFNVSEYGARRGRDRVCSPECRGASRKNITRYDVDGKMKTLTELANEHGVKPQTAWMRMKRGWTLLAAVGAVNP